MKNSNITILIFLLAIKLSAQWISDLTLNTPISIADLNQFKPVMISDGEGGAIITWYDYRTNNIPAIYSQRVNAEGYALWAENGVLVSPSNSSQTNPALVNDGSGGAFICWWDFRNIPNYSIYVQRINPDGVKHWQEDIKIAELTISTGTSSAPKIKSDNLNGAVIIWETDNGDINAQRISPDGTLLWGVDGIPVVSDNAVQTIPDIICDEAGSSIITWLDHRNSSPDLYIQKIGADGTPQWLANGIQLTDVNGYQTYPAIASDGANGAIVTWVDYRDGIFPDIYAQKISSNGIIEWQQNGVGVCIYDTIQTNPLILNSTDGAYICWNDYRNGKSDLFAQKLDINGIKLWAVNGISVTSNSSDKKFQSMTVNINDHLIVTWADGRNGATNQDIFAQALNVNGGTLWEQQGVPICIANNNQSLPRIVESSNGSSIIVWYDGRNTPYFDIYAQKILSDGSLGNPTSIEENFYSLIDFNLFQNYPNPFNPSTTIKYTIPNVTLSGVEGSRVELKVYDVLGNEVAVLVDEYKDAGSYQVEFNASQLSSGIYLYKLKAGDFIQTRKMIYLK